MQICPVKRVVDLDRVLLLEEEMVIDLVLVEEHRVGRLERQVRKDFEFQRMHELVTKPCVSRIVTAGQKEIVAGLLEIIGNRCIDWHRKRHIPISSITILCPAQHGHD